MRRLIILLLGVIFLSGCFSPANVPPISTYTLTNAPSTKTFVAKKSGAHGTLLVSTPMASPGYDTDDMIYVVIPYQLKSFANNRWIAPPSELLLPLLTNRLRSTGHFRAVVSSPFSGSVTYQLNTQLLTLQQEFIQPQSEVRLVIEATLMNSVTGRVIASRVFKTIVPTMGNNPYGGVMATNKAAHQLINQISGFVVRHT